MIPEPLNGVKDAKPLRPTIAGHRFEWLSGRCEMIHSRGEGALCNKLYSEIANAPLSAVDDAKQSGLWCGEGTLIRREWDEIQAENQRIFNACKS